MLAAHEMFKNANRVSQAEILRAVFLDTKLLVLRLSKAY